MQFFAQYADAFDQSIAEDDMFLEEVGEQLAQNYLDNPSGGNSFALGSWGLVHGAHSFATFFAKGYADVLRIGEGSKQGGWGYGQDALRALVVAGPATRLIKNIAGKAGIGSGFLRSPFQNCTWIASALALRLTGTRLFARVGDLVRAANVPLQNLGRRAFPMLGHTERWVHQLIPAMRSLGATVKQLGSAEKPAFNAMSEVIRTAQQNRRSVVLFSLGWTMKTAGGARQVGHTLVGRVTAWGFRIFDRSGRVVKSLDELDDLYPGISKASLYGSGAIVDNATSFYLRGASGLLSMLALEVEPYLIKANQPPPKSSVQPPASTQGRDNGNHRGKLEPNMTCTAPYPDSSEVVCTSYYTYTVGAVDSLSNISQKVYGSPAHWRLIYEANRHILGPDPHNPYALKAGMVLQIPAR